MGNSIHVLHSLPSLSLNSGGPPRSVGQICGHLCDYIDSVRIITRYEGDEPLIKLDPRITVSKVRPSGVNPIARLLSPSYTKELERLHELQPLSLIHRHGIWLKCSQDAVNFASRNGIPSLVSPRGMLEPWSLQYRAFKKKLAWYTYQRNSLQKVSMFHATSEMEAESIRSCGFTQPIVVIPNGVELPDAYRGAPKKHGEKVALFLSRINPKKGLPMLLEAWSRQRPEGWKLRIAGNDDANHQVELMAQVARLKLSSSVDFVGPLYGEAKETAYREADIFVLPTFSENFGIVVAEALSYGVPVITTTGTPWQELSEYRCGWFVKPNVGDLQTTLDSAFSKSRDELQEMGVRGQELIRRRYQWPAIATQMAEAYRWLLGEGEKPDTVLLGDR